MFLANDFRAHGEPPRKKRKSIPTHKGYPAIRTPQAENPTGILSKNLDEASLYRLRQRYSNKQHLQR